MKTAEIVSHDVQKISDMFGDHDSPGALNGSFQFFEESDPLTIVAYLVCGEDHE